MDPRTTDAAPPRTETSRHVATRLGSLHVRELRSEESEAGGLPPVVVWHSMFVDSTSWDRTLPHLADRHLFLVDGPSSGGSEPLTRASDIAGCADAAVDLLGGLGLTAPVDWLGSAWGGHVGIRLAATHPDLIRSLVAVSAPTHPIDLAVRTKVVVLRALYRLIGVRGPVASGAASSLLTDHTRRHDPDGVDLLLGPFRRADRRGMALTMQTAILDRVSLAVEARAIRCPVLFVTTDDRGEWSPEAAQAVAATMHDAREVTVTGSRVLPSIEQPEALARAVNDFWDSAHSLGPRSAG